MDAFVEELVAGWPDTTQFLRIVFRLSVATLLGAVIGIQRERAGKPAGLRTHMLVALGAALFVVAGRESGMSSSDMSRVIQGLITGIGFIGAGAILKREDKRSHHRPHVGGRHLAHVCSGRGRRPAVCGARRRSPWR